MLGLEFGFKNLVFFVFLVFPMVLARFFGFGVEKFSFFCFFGFPIGFCYVYFFKVGKFWFFGFPNGFLLSLFVL